MHKDKRLWKFPHGRDWLWGNLHLALMGGAMLSSVTQSCRTLCDPMDCSTPGLLVHHQLPEFTQIHVHWVGDAMQLSHHLSSPSLPAFNLSQHQGLFQWVSSSRQVAKELEFQLQHPVLPMNIQDWFPLGLTDWFDLLAVQGTLKSLLQHRSSKASILALSFLYSSTLTSIHNYWRNYSLD